VPRKEADDGLAFDWQVGMHVRMRVPVDPHEVPESREDDETPDFFHGVITQVNNADWCKLQVCHHTPIHRCYFNRIIRTIRLSDDDPPKCYNFHVSYHTMRSEPLC
jgi:hypothetical protein